MKLRKVTVLLSVLVILSSSCVTTKHKLAKTIEKEPYDAVIVPGMPFYKDWSDNEMKGRVAWSWFLYSRGYTKNVIYSGSAVYSPYVESRIMAKYGEALGIPAENIFCEIRAQHSTENMIYGIRLAEKQGFKRIAVATDSFQSAFLKLFAWDFNIEVDFIPFNPDSLRIVANEEINIDPSGAYIDDFIALPAKEGFLKRFSGTMGYGIREY